MPITRSFAVQGITNAAGAWMRKSGRDTAWTRAQSDARFRTAILVEAINELLTGDLDTGKAMLRDYVNASITFDGLAKATRLPSKSLQRMLGPRGNPTAESLFTIIKVLQSSERIRLVVTHKRAATGLKGEFRGIQSFWSRKAKEKGILTEKDLARYLAK